MATADAYGQHYYTNLHNSNSGCLNYANIDNALQATIGPNGRRRPHPLPQQAWQVIAFPRGPSSAAREENVTRLVQVISIIGVCLLAQACSTDRPPAYMEHSKRANVTPQANGATPQGAPSPSGNAAPAPERIVLEDKNLTNEEVKQIFALGYKPVERHGEVYYCRREVTTGSRFDKMTCRTGDEVKRLTQASKDTLTELQGTGGCRGGDTAHGC